MTKRTYRPVNMRAKLGLILPPTREEVMAKWPKAAGGHTRNQLADWGVDWPPTLGWIDRLEFRRATIERKMARQAAGRAE